MVNYIWAGMIIIGLLFAGINGKMNEVSEAIFQSANEAVTLCIGLISVLVFWLGMMKIAEDAVLLEKIAQWLSPLVQKLFPDIPKNHPAIGYIMSNISANMLGLGNAATPMGIKAMEELQKLNPDKERATPAMCTLLAINTAGFTLIPTTIIAIRLNLDSANPAEIVGTTLLATAVATTSAILIDRWYRRRNA